MHLILFLVILVAFIGVWLKYLPNSKAGKTEHPMRELVRLCSGDISLAERLIDHEMKKNARLTPKRAIQNAIFKLKQQR